MTQTFDDLNNYIVQNAQSFNFPYVLESRSQIYTHFKDEPGHSYGIEFYYDRSPATQCMPAKYVAAKTFEILTTTKKDLIHHNNECRTEADVMTVEGSNGWAIFGQDCNPMIVPICERKFSIKKAWKAKVGVDSLALERSVSAAIDYELDKKIRDQRKEFARFITEQEEFNQLSKELAAKLGVSPEYIKDLYKDKIAKTSPHEQVSLEGPFSLDKIEQYNKFAARIKKFADELLEAKAMIQSDLKDNADKASKFETLITKVDEKQAGSTLVEGYCAVYDAYKYSMFSSEAYRDVMSGDNNLKLLRGELQEFLEQDITC